MRKADIISSAVVALLGLALLFVIIPVWVPTILDGDYGLRANDMPQVAALTITLLAAGFFLYRLRSPAAATEDDEQPPISRRNGRFLLTAAVFLVALAAIFDLVGFLAAGPVAVAGFMLMMGERRPVAIAVTAIGVPVLVWLFFVKLLQFPLP